MILILSAQLLLVNTSMSSNLTHAQDALKIENDDWLATCAIYGDEVTEIQRLSHGSGFHGCIQITMATEYIAFFRSIRDKEGHFRYLKLSKQPQLLLQFKYICEDGVNDGDRDLNNAIPISVTIQWLAYPEEWPDQEKKKVLAAIWQKSNEILREEKLSYGVCEYCEHQAINEYENWPIFHREDPFRMIRLPEVTDSLYHRNHGTLIHVHREAQKLPSNELSSKSTPKKKRARVPVVIDAKMLVRRKQPATLEEYARQALLDEWKQLYTADCPICFDTLLYSEGVVLPCHHFVCEYCLSSMLHFKVTELGMYRVNPFACPVDKCRHSLPIIGFVKKYLPPDEMDKVRKWIKDMKFPPCLSLDRCLHTKTCGGFESMRRRQKDSTVIYCDQCHKNWCEMCLKRLNEDGTDEEGFHGKDTCQDTIAWQFCKRYLAASDDKKRTCEEKYPWIVSYAHAREHDGDAMTWILQNGQVCPNCQNGVERIAGCFHMQCPTCATHFCYECGDELFPPYYGTHHCWERTKLQL